MKGKNEDLFQYNTKVSIPFVLSNKNYGLLWDSYSYCRFGNPNDYLQLNRAFKLYDKQGREGHLTGTYVDRQGKKLVRDEDSIYYEYGTPAKSEIALKTDNGGIKNFPKEINLMGRMWSMRVSSNPSVVVSVLVSRRRISSSSIIADMSRFISMARRLCLSAGAQLGIPIPISLRLMCVRALRTTCALNGSPTVVRPIAACVWQSLVVPKSVDNSPYGVRWASIWTITSLLVRISIRSSQAIAL